MPEHIHKLKRFTYTNGTKVYFCTNNCNFKVDVGLALGKVVLCNICNEPFTMNEYSIKLARPHCNGCGKVQVRDTEGKRKFINKNRPTQAIAEIGQSAVNDLKQRLGSISVMEKPEEDI